MDDKKNIFSLLPCFLFRGCSADSKRKCRSHFCLALAFKFLQSSKLAIEKKSTALSFFSSTAANRMWFQTTDLFVFEAYQKYTLSVSVVSVVVKGMSILGSLLINLVELFLYAYLCACLHTYFLIVNFSKNFINIQL